VIWCGEFMRICPQSPRRRESEKKEKRLKKKKKYKTDLNSYLEFWKSEGLRVKEVPTVSLRDREAPCIFECVKCQFIIGKVEGYDFTNYQSRNSIKILIASHFKSNDHFFASFNGKTRKERTRTAWKNVVTLFFDVITEYFYSDELFVRRCCKAAQNRVFIGNQYHTHQMAEVMLERLYLICLETPKELIRDIVWQCRDWNIDGIWALRGSIWNMW